MVRFVVICTLFLFASCVKESATKEDWIVVNGILVEGEFAQLTLTNAVGFDETTAPNSVSGAKVRIDGPDNSVLLTEIEGFPGRYSDTAGEMLIEANKTYSLVITKEDQRLEAEATVPGAVNIVQSSATMIPINPSSTGEPIYSIFWSQEDNISHVLTLDLQEDVFNEIPFSVSSGNFSTQYAFPVPGQGTTVFDTDFAYYGTHMLTVYAIDEDYDALFFYQNGSGGDQVTEGLNNIDGGSGYFAGASKLEVELEIFEE